MQGVGFKSPGDALNIAGIGTGDMGAADLKDVESENIIALCDVDWEYAAHTCARYPQAKRYKDHRVMLEKQKDIDAVIVATPDYMYAPISMAAINIGKHVYTEKPLTHTVKSDIQTVFFELPVDLFGVAADILVQRCPKLWSMIFHFDVHKFMQNDVIHQRLRQLD